jgi:polyphosphate kinase
VLLHHPYESYDVIVDFLREAASDKNVLSIKQTLYRVSSEESPIVKALCKAANNGIKVTVMLELLARFDEKRNLNLIDKLKAAGVSIVYSLENLKTHCKMILVTKKTKKGLHQYSYMATGNFNEKTARLYTDISLFTSSKKFGKDLNTVFNTLTGYSKPNHLEIISVAPNTLRDRLYELIKFEMEEAKKNRKALIKIKVNSICDLGIMDMLKKASRAGVKIQILCRGICSIKPDENIAIYSIIGKNLEHSRIYEFYHAGTWKRFISSADLLSRNLDKRIELLIPVKDKDCGKKLNKIFNRIYRKDTFNKFVMKRNGSYKFLNGKVDTQK